MSSAEIIYLNGKGLDEVLINKIAFAKEGELQVAIDPKAVPRLEQSRNFVLDIVKNNKPVYGINTGFGALSDRFIPADQLEQLQLNLVRSHCCGVGKPFSKAVVRAIVLLRANCLISGYSGVNPEIVSLMLEFLNKHITPIVPEKGSVGASGDLAPLAHIALCLIGEGDVEYQGKTSRSDFVLNLLKLKPAVLGPKDGLALINGTSVMAALGSIALGEVKKIFKFSDIVASMTLDSVKGTSKAYDEDISRIKPHSGQIACAQNLNRLLDGSQIKDSHDDCGKVQDPYSLRCVPQVHGACRQTYWHARDVLNTEFNSVTDNPLIFLEENKVVSGGNFHGEAIALAMDYLAMGVSELSNISERRVEKMMNPTFSDLPAFLTEGSGLNSGYMIAHVTSAALTSENKYLCHPASVDSIPTSTDKEDHVSMGVTSGRKLLEVIYNTKMCLAIEALCCSQALDFQRPLKSSPAIEAVHELIRKHVPFSHEDHVLSKEMNTIFKLIESNELIEAAEKHLGELK